MIGPYKTEDEFAAELSDMARTVWRTAESTGEHVLFKVRPVGQDFLIVCGIEPYVGNLIPLR